MAFDESIQIASLQDGQIAIIQALEQNSSQHPWSNRQLADCLDHDYLIQTFAFDSEPEEIIGYWILQQVVDELHLLNFTISKSYQGRGIGTKVLRQLIENQRSEQGISSIYLEVRESNIAAQAVYSKCGFQQIGERKHYYRNGLHEREKAILMRCIICG